jgi:hypothetical protein
VGVFGTSAGTEPGVDGYLRGQVFNREVPEKKCLEFYRLFCVDITSSTERVITVPVMETTIASNTETNKYFIAVQKYPPCKKIPCDFDAIVEAHH